jgi:hypothetical protein
MKGTLIDTWEENRKEGKTMSIRKANRCAKPSETPVDTQVKLPCFDADAPLNDLNQDLLGRAKLAQHIADGIAGSDKSTSLVVGVYGSWGSGKSTVLNFTDCHLKRMPNIIRLRFDPWIIGGEEELLLAFMTSLARAVNISERPRAKKIAGTAAKILDYASGLIRLGGLDPKIAPITSVAADASKDIADKLKELSQISLDGEKILISKGLEESDERIVVFMDDLDRLDKSELCAVMKLVKLVADFPSVTYVLAFDDHMVARSIGEMYTKAASEDDAEKAGKDYLEKIVQVPIRLPIPTEPALRSIMLRTIVESVDQYDKMFEKNDQEVRRLVTDFDAGVLPFIHTPRRVKQIGTRIKWALSTMGHEVNTVDVVLLEALAVCQPELYQYVLDRPDLFCGRPRESSDTAETKRLRQKAKEEVESRAEAERDGEHRGIWSLLQNIFPGTQWLTGPTTYERDENLIWERDQRVASEQYLKRYIHMTIPETDVSDVAVRNVIDELPRMSTTNGKALLGSILTSQNAQTLVFKLRYQARALGQPSAIALVHAVALLGDQLPRVEGIYSLLSAAEEGPILIRDLFARIEDLSLRKEVALEVLGESTSLRFATEVFRRIQYRPESSDSRPNLFDNGSTNGLADVVLERIRDMAKRTKPIYVESLRDAQDLLLFWEKFGSKNEAKNYVTKTIQADPANAMHLIYAFQPTPQSLETGQIFRDSLDADSFLLLRRIVDVSAMRVALEKTLGTKLAGDKLEYVPHDVDDRQLAEQFAYFCEHPPKEQSDATAQPPENG